MTLKELIHTGLLIAGGAQLTLCMASVAIPRNLRWVERTAGLVPFIRQMFYTYAVYVLGAHLFFALTTLMLADELMAGSGIGNMLLVFMGAWWTGRIYCQFFYFDRTGIPETRFNKVAEGILVVMFFALVTVYWGALIWNLTR